MKKINLVILFLIFAPAFVSSTMEQETEPIAKETEISPLFKAMNLKKVPSLKQQVALPLLKIHSDQEIMKLNIPEDLKEYLLAQRKDISKALLNQVSYGDVQAVKTLLMFGADVNAQTDEGLKALSIASWNLDQVPHQEIATILIEQGADVNAQDLDGFTPLFKAADSGLLDLAKLLLEHGADPNHSTKRMGTVLNAALLGDHQEVVELLKQYGAKD